MGALKRLDLAFENVPVLPLSPHSRYVLFSDCHRGIGTASDNFLKNQHLYLAALKHYSSHDFTYIELGDGDELWENRSMEQIKEVHSDVFSLLSDLHAQNRLYMLYGNHDMVNQNSIHHSGLILKNCCPGKDIYLTHGHQVDFFNSILWRTARFLVRYLWKPLETLGFLDPTSAAKNNTKKEHIEQTLTTWAKAKDCFLITGHTHRPMMGSDKSPYFNCGSCVHPSSITCIEITDGQIILVKWTLSSHQNGSLFVERIELADPVKF